jgi:hypothetical protein
LHFGSVKGQLPQFAYQLHLASGEVEKSVKDEQSIRQFLKGLYGARGPKGELAFDPEQGVLAGNLPLIGESRILNGKVSGISKTILRMGNRRVSTRPCLGTLVKLGELPSDPRNDAHLQLGSHRKG